MIRGGKIHTAWQIVLKYSVWLIGVKIKNKILLIKCVI